MLISLALFCSGLAEILTEVRSKTPDNVDDYSILDCEDEEYALYDPNCYLQVILFNKLDTILGQEPKVQAPRLSR